MKKKIVALGLVVALSVSSFTDADGDDAGESEASE